MARRKKTEKRELSHEDIPRNTRATAWRAASARSGSSWMSSAGMCSPSSASTWSITALSPTRMGVTIPSARARRTASMVWASPAAATAMRARLGWPFTWAISSSKL